ncbi:hypothetical protein DFH09DRAFT_1108624 [Mycena vulgaris]|nr:hypothetical protein DFH09DRAFT_1108624 [Mycena vulgaris]
MCHTAVELNEKIHFQCLWLALKALWDANIAEDVPRAGSPRGVTWADTLYLPAAPMSAVSCISSHTYMVGPYQAVMLLPKKSTFFSRACRCRKRRRFYPARSDRYLLPQLTELSKTPAPILSGTRHGTGGINRGRDLNLVKPLEEQDNTQIDALVKSVGTFPSLGWLVIDLPQIREARTPVRKYPDARPVFKFEVRASAELGLTCVASAESLSRVCRHQIGRPSTHVSPDRQALPTAPGNAVYEAFFERARSWAAWDAEDRPAQPAQEFSPALLFLGMKMDTQFTNIFMPERAKAQLLADLLPLSLSVFRASKIGASHSLRGYEAHVITA